MSLSKKSKIRIVVILSLLVITACSIYAYVFKPHDKVVDITSEYIGSANDFMVKIKEDAKLWNSKIVTLTGEISSLEANGIILENNIFCQFDNASETLNLQKGKTTTIKGHIIGYDDLFDELKLNQCIIQLP